MAHMNMSWRNRAVALIATAALGGAMAVGAVAPTSAWAETGTVTINQKANQDAKYQAFQLFKADISLKGQASIVEWGEGIDEAKQGQIAAQLDALTSNGYTAWLTAKNLTDPADKTNPQNALDFISKTITDQGAGPGVVVDAGDFAHTFAKWLQTSSGITAGTATAGQPFTSAEGYYLFVTDPASLAEGEVATAPIWFPLGYETKEINEKATAPTVDKDVNGNYEGGDVEIGDTLPFTITATLPSNYGSFDMFKMVLTDTPTHLAIKEGVVVKADGKDITAAEGVHVVREQDGSSLTVTINDLKKAAPNAKADTTVTVEYTAELLPGASTTPGDNKNEVTYEFSNDPNSDGTGTTTDKPVPVYTFLLDLLKQDEKTQEALKDAGFTICNGEDKYFNKDTGKWDLDKDGAELEANLLTTADTGKVEVSGLASGTYTITEVKTPEGYEAQKGYQLTFNVEVTYNEDGSIDTLAIKDQSGNLKATITPDKTTGTIKVIANNNKEITLAMTGAEGVGLVGVGVLVAGLAWYLVRSRRQNADQA